MSSSSSSSLSSILLLIFFSLILTTITTTAQNTFTCTTPNTNCSSIIEYILPNTTTLSSIQRLFSIPNHRTLLGANNLSLSTPNTTIISSGQTVRIPFPCTCRNNTGISNQRPIYTVVPNDTLYHIAAEVFSNLVTFQEIQDVNRITNPDLIEIGQRLWIPLPCSCDEVDGASVVHYGYTVRSGNSVDGIAERFNVSGETIMRLNNLTGPNDLIAGAVLDVPLRACSSVINNSSRDYPLLVANGTYVFTANNCVRCSCDAANNWMLQCEPFQFNSSCSPIRCEGPDNLFLGNTTSSGCNRTTCAYAGYNLNITTALSVESTCPASNNGSSGIRFQWWNSLLITIHVMLLCVSFFN